MMQDPWFYVIVIAVLSVAILAPMVVLRVLAARERSGGDPTHDPHLR